jgi:hypothetical protein
VVPAESTAAACSVSSKCREDGEGERNAVDPDAGHYATAACSVGIRTDAQCYSAKAGNHMYAEKWSVIANALGVTIRT